MKSCSKIHPLLSLEAEGALSARDHQKVQAHLRDCPDARKRLASYKRMRRTLRALPEPKEPHNLHEKIMVRLHEKKSGPAKKPFYFRPLWPLAAAAVTTVCFFIQYPNWQDRMTSQQKTAPAPANQPVLAAADKKTQPVPAAIPMARQSTSSDQVPVHSMGSVTMMKQKDEMSAESSVSDNTAGAPAAAPPMAMAFNAEKKRHAIKTQSARAAAPAASLQDAYASAPAPEAERDSAAVSTWSGTQDTHATIAQQSLLTDETSFDNAWRLLEPGKPVPTVDFATQAVVFLEAGLEPTAGYEIHVLQLEDKSDHLVIHWGNTHPSAESLPAQMVTYPWLLQVIDKPSKPVTFTEDE
jgi:hypothetical protein